jgi:hypothetical protein
MGAVLARCPFYLLMLYWLAGCAFIGPTVVQNGRDTYNEAVASSARQQTLINIVRVHRNETPVFLEIPEIDASSLLQVGATGAVTNLGSHAGTVGSTLEGVARASGLSAQYQEAPTIRYQPVQGQALFNIGPYHGRHPVGAFRVRLGFGAHVRLCVRSVGAGLRR